LVKIEIKSVEMNPNIFGVDGRLWKLVNDIIIEKWSLIDGDFRGGDISENLLKRICRVLRERMEGKRLLEWDLETQLRGYIDET